MMYVTITLGVVALANALRLAARPSAARLGFVTWMSCAVGASALLGTTFGAIGTGRAVGLASADQKLRIFAEGFSESLNNLAMGLIFLTFIVLAAAIGRLRLALPD